MRNLLHQKRLEIDTYQNDYSTYLLRHSPLRHPQNRRRLSHSLLMIRRHHHRRHHHQMHTHQNSFYRTPKLLSNPRHLHFPPMPQC